MLHNTTEEGGPYIHHCCKEHKHEVCMWRISPHNPLPLNERVLSNATSCCMLKLTRLYGSLIDFSSNHITISTHHALQQIHQELCWNIRSQWCVSSRLYGWRIFEVSDFPWNSTSNNILLCPWQSLMKLSWYLWTHNNISNHDTKDWRALLAPSVSQKDEYLKNSKPHPLELLDPTNDLHMRSHVPWKNYHHIWTIILTISIWLCLRELNQWVSEVSLYLSPVAISRRVREARNVHSLWIPAPRQKYLNQNSEVLTSIKSTIKFSLWVPYSWSSIVCGRNIVPGSSRKESYPRSIHIWRYYLTNNCHYLEQISWYSN